MMERTHDAELQLKVPPTDGESYGPDRVLAWWWSDGRRTVTPTEHDEMERLIDVAEERFDLDELTHGDRVACIYMDGETIVDIEWNKEYRGREELIEAKREILDLMEDR